MAMLGFPCILHTESKVDDYGQRMNNSAATPFLT
jgi:hypothetical protein